MLDLGALYISMEGEEVDTPSRRHRIKIVAVKAGEVVVQRLDAPSRRFDRVPLRVLNEVAADVQAGKFVPTSSITANMNGPVAALLNVVPWIVVDGRPQIAHLASGYAELTSTERASAPVEPMPTGWEGDARLVLHFRRERDPGIRRAKLAQVLERAGVLSCEACGFDFAQCYGDLGRGFAECHHIQPLAAGVRETTLDDLAVVCANCHRMIHRSAVPLDLEALRRILA